MKVKPPTTNYARCIFTGYYVFFNDTKVPNFEHPEVWAYYRVPRGVDPKTFRGQLVGVNPPESNTETPASAPS